jgi:hypothetical protein
MHNASRSAHAPAPLAPDLRARLAAAVERDGEENLRRRIGLARDSFARALGGLTITRGTAVIIREALDAAADPGPPAA